MAGTMHGFATTGFAETHKAPITVSVLAHLLLLAAISTSLVFVPSQPIQQLAIEAVVVDESQLRRAAEAERQQQLDAQRRQREEQERQRQLEQQRQEREAAAREEQRRQAALEEQRRVAEANAAAERRAAEQRAAEQRAAEQRAAEQRAAEERRRQEAEAAAQREAERKAAEERARAEAARREQQRRQAELAAALAAEEELLAARNSGAMSRYVALIAQKVERKWVQPASAVAGIECQVSVQQLPNGEVISARVTQCNGDETVRRSVEAAVLSASPLPLPEDRVLFERNLRFTFRPQLGN